MLIFSLYPYMHKTSSIQMISYLLESKRTSFIIYTHYLYLSIHSQLIPLYAIFNIFINIGRPWTLINPPCNKLYPACYIVL